MRVAIDTECNALESPTEIWLICCLDLDTGDLHTFREVTKNAQEKHRFLQFAQSVQLWVGHNLLGYDLPVLSNLIGFNVRTDDCIDTLITSKLVDYSLDGHSIEAYGERFGFPKIKFSDFSQYSTEMEVYCARDCEICGRIYKLYQHVIDDPDWLPSIRLEHDFQLIVNSLHDNGFSFNSVKCQSLLHRVERELEKLDKEILSAFPDRPKLIREITPRLTKHGTLNKADFRFEKSGDLSGYNGGPFCHFEWVAFNPSSHRQIVDVLTQAGWSPVDKTTTHIQTERELNRLKYQRNRSAELDLEISALDNKVQAQRVTGWKINETNLATLPDAAPAPAKTLAKRILLESRRRTLTEWINLVYEDDGRIHGKFYAIGAWTHRMAHQNPNTANIPTDAKLFGGEMRSLWQAPQNRLLVGCDAEGIQLRIFAHYIDDEEFTHALVKGSKSDKTDPHSLNQRILGRVCRSRQDAKRFIYALLLGAGIDKLTQILQCSRSECEDALSRLIARYTGWAELKKTIIPADARRGYFIGLDGRKVKLSGDTEGTRRHLCMSGYLQNGEAIVMKMACLLWHRLLQEEGLEFLLVNFVHDEWQTECKNDMQVAHRIATLQADSLRIVGEQLKLKCPLAGSFYNEDHHDYTIGTNWRQTH